MSADLRSSCTVNLKSVVAISGLAAPLLCTAVEPGHWELPREYLRDNGVRGEVILNGWWEVKDPATDAVRWERIPNIIQPGTGTVEKRIRREFHLPPGWEHRELVLEIGNLNSGGKIFLNGVLLGDIPRRQPPERFLEFPVPSDLLRGDRQELCIVTDMIGDDVWLRAFPRSEARVTDSYIIPSTRRRDITLELQGTGRPGKRVTATAAIHEDADGHRIVKRLPPLSFTIAGDGQWRAVLSAPWEDAKWWSPWEPHLYWYTVELADADGNRLDALLPRRFGFREVWTENKKFMLNGKPLYFSGDTWSRTMNGRTQMREQLLSTMRIFHEFGLLAVARLMSDVAFAAADEVGIIIAQASIGGLDVPMQVVAALARDEAGDAGGDADFTGGDEESYRASQERLARFIRRWREHPSILTWSIRSPWSRITLDSTRQGLSEEPWRFWPGNEDEEAVENNRRRYLAASITADFVRRMDPHRPISAQNNPDIEVEFATRYLCDNLDLQEREMFFVYFMENDSPKVLMPSEAGMPFPGHQLLRRKAHQMPQGANYPAIHLENAARLFGDQVYAEEPEDRFPQWHRRDYIWHKESPVYQRLTAENMLWVWRGWRAAGINTLAHWVLREGFAISAERTNVAERLGIPSAVDPRRPGRSEVGGIVRNDAFPLPGVDRELAGGIAYRRGIAPLTAWIGGGPGTRVFNKDHLYHSGDTIRKAIVVLNDFHWPIPLAGEWRFIRKNDGALIARGDLRHTVGPGARDLGAMPIQVNAPQVAGRTEFVLSFVLDSERGRLQDEFPITIYPPAPKMARPRRRVWLLSEDRDGWSASIGLEATILRPDLSLDDVSENDLVIVPRQGLDVERWRHFRLDQKILDGLRVLILEQDVDNILGLRTETVRPRRVFIAAKGHPILEGFEDSDFRHWTGASNLQPAVPTRNTPDLRKFPERIWQVSNENSVATRTLLRPQLGAARALLVSGFDLQETPLLEVARGKGRMIFCQLDVSNRIGTDPIATRLLGRLIHYLDTAPVPDPGREAVRVLPEQHDEVEMIARLYRAEPPKGPAGWGVTRAELFFRESIYRNDWITAVPPELRIPVLKGTREVVKMQPDTGLLMTTLHPDLFQTGWGKQKVLFLHSALRINQGGSSAIGPALEHQGHPQALYPVDWHPNFIHPYTAACW